MFAEEKTSDRYDGVVCVWEKILEVVVQQNSKEQKTVEKTSNTENAERKLHRIGDLGISRKWQGDFFLPLFIILFIINGIVIEFRKIEKLT